MNDFKTDIKWSNKFIPTIRKLVGEYLLVPSTLQQDMEEAADLVVLKGRDLTIACRIRRAGYSERYPDDFTIRFERTSGAKTEYQKIVEGWGDWMFYGHSLDNESDIISRWMLLDLSHFRAHLIQNRKAIIFNDKDNGDGTFFRAFDAKSFTGDPKILIAENEYFVDQPF